MKNYITFDKYINNNNINKKAAKEIENLLTDYKVIENTICVPKRMAKIDFRLVPKKIKQENIIRSILKVINEFKHINYKILKIKEYQFNALIKELESKKLIKKVYFEETDRLVIENYLITKKGNRIISSLYKKALQQIEKINFNFTINQNLFL